MAIDIPAARARAVEAVRDFYSTPHEHHDHSNAERDAHEAVTFAVDHAGITHREIASLAGVPGLLVARLIDTPTSHVEALRLERHAADRYAREVMDLIRQSALELVQPGAQRGIHSQAGFAKSAGVDRMAVRGWLGLR